jgi:hypothetical protein
MREKKYNTKCANCGKKMFSIFRAPFGHTTAKHDFCSLKCRWEYRDKRLKEAEN